MIQQISIFAENRTGKLEKVTGVLAAAGVNIRTVTIADLGDFGVIKIVVDDPLRAHDLLRAAGLAVRLNDVVAVSVADEVGGLDRAGRVLRDKGINLKNAHGFVLEKGKQAVLLFEVDQPQQVAQVLAEAGFQALTEADLAGA